MPSGPMLHGDRREREAEDYETQRRKDAKVLLIEMQESRDKAE
jgi:hypothetical protein